MTEFAQSFELTASGYKFIPAPGRMFFPAHHPRWWEGWRACYGQAAPEPPQYVAALLAGPGYDRLHRPVGGARS
jgi:hypothetical protein